MYVRKIGEQKLEFGHRGWLLDESFIFYDRRYDSLWVQATGTCIDGKFKGHQLATIPVTHTTWGRWRTLHPDTGVLAKPAELLERYREDVYGALHERNETRFGLAVFVGDRQKFYPLEELHGDPVVTDEIAGQPVLVVFHAPSRTAVAFDPTVEGELVRFELAEVTDDDVLLRFGKSGIWSGLTGRALRSDDETRSLRQLRSTQFAAEKWPYHYPGGPVYKTP